MNKNINEKIVNFTETKFNGNQKTKYKIDFKTFDYVEYTSKKTNKVSQKMRVSYLNSNKEVKFLLMDANEYTARRLTSILKVWKIKDVNYNDISINDLAKKIVENYNGNEKSLGLMIIPKDDMTFSNLIAWIDN